MCNAITNRPSHCQVRPERATNPFRNANVEAYNNPHHGQNQGGLSLSAEAMAGMRMMAMVGCLMTGDFGQLMGLMGMGQANGAGQRPCSTSCPGFGERGVGGPPTENAPSVANAAKVGKGQTKELKEGETVRGANGTQLTWGQGDNVDVKYKDRNGQTKTISVKDGMISFDGGKPQKLENTGQMLKLPNGDVIGLGNQNTGNGGKDLCRVVMADNPDKIACHPPQATNIYDVEQMEHRQTSMEGGGVSMNFNTASFQTPMGTANFASASMQVFMGHPVTRVFTEQLMSHIGAK